MMTNLFSMFDPATYYFSNINWLATLLVFFVTPLNLWTMKSSNQKVLMSLKSYLITEFTTVVKKMPLTIIYFPTIFILLAANNLMGLLPFVFTSTAHMSISVALALPMWTALMLTGWINNSNNLLIHLLPKSTPSLLMPFMIIIETLSNLIRPLTLAIRLSANMIAGHILVVLLTSAMHQAPIAFMPILLGSSLALSTLETAVSVIQAYVMTTLAVLYAAEFTD